MSLKIAIWTDGLDEEFVGGPWVALRRMLGELNDLETEHEIRYVHTDPTANLELYENGQDVIMNKTLPNHFRDVLPEFDVVMTNTVPGSLSNLLFHRYQATTVAWLHGSGPWVPEYSYGQKFESPSPRTQLKQLRRKWIMRQGVKQMDQLVTNSEFNRRVMMEGMGAPSSVEVIRYGLDHHNFRPYSPDDESEVRGRFGLEKPFIIYVANRAPKKQPHVAVRSFKHVKDAGFDHELVIVGSRYKESSVPKTIESLGLEDDVVFTGYVEEDSTIGKLFSAADCSIFPTLHETFGMPVLESMAAGCPIVTSNTTVIPEVAGDAGILVDDPTDPSAIGDAVISVLEDKNYRQSLSKRGRSRAEEFQWKTCAEEFLELFDEIEREQ